ncbi:DUF6712 family protein [Faecalibacter sp. LW9]|uniref:DUF6712 family protein n=1 Tax=Faecalibacter sp. LW9 TaxID=3103144 RepID=UPI002AFE0389|nr:DUF6712 family protein [Faecalibacter sp. LW9]
MKLIISNNSELIKFLPMLDKSITFDRLKQDLRLATEEVIKLIGDDMYEYIEGLYSADTKTEIDLQLIDVVAYPIAVDAYRNYVIQNDVAHTNEGRKARLNDYEKMPFEWMIDRDNKTSERKYYKALDRLIEYFDKHNPNNWKESDEYKKSFSVLFRTTEQFNEYFTIESRYLLLKLVPGIKKCINEEIIPRIGQASWNEIDVKLKANELVPDAYLFAKIKEACAYYALHWGMLRMSATLFPEGVLQNYLAGRQQVPTNGEIGIIAKCFENDYKNVLLKIESHLTPVVNGTGTIDLDSLLDIDDDDKIVNLC